MRTLHLAVSTSEARFCCKAAIYTLKGAYTLHEMYSSVVDINEFVLTDEADKWVLRVVPHSGRWFSNSEALARATDAIIRELALERLGVTE